MKHVAHSDWPMLSWWVFTGWNELRGGRLEQEHEGPELSEMHWVVWLLSQFEATSSQDALGHFACKVNLRLWQMAVAFSTLALEAPKGTFYGANSEPCPSQKPFRKPHERQRETQSFHLCSTFPHLIRLLYSTQVKLWKTKVSWHEPSCIGQDFWMIQKPTSSQCVCTYCITESVPSKLWPRIF